MVGLFFFQNTRRLLLLISVVIIFLKTMYMDEIPVVRMVGGALRLLLV